MNGDHFPYKNSCVPKKIGHSRVLLSIIDVANRQIDCVELVVCALAELVELVDLLESNSPSVFKYNFLHVRGIFTAVLGFICSLPLSGTVKD